ncbi:MAG: hypothetical protein E7190_10375 [Erysipelotrichaceae bacterium]|nr:hypothetical protein [Erysipelotrichaceae bacterium]
MQKTDKFIPQYVPEKLQNLKCWCLWKLSWNAERGKYDKVPYSVKGVFGCQNKPDLWATYDEAIAVLKRSSKYNGVGICMHKSFGFVFVDVDHCIGDDGKITAIGLRVLRWFGKDTYIEYSQSKKGVHILSEGSIPGSFRNAVEDVEMYDSVRLCAFTGIPYVEEDIHEAQEALMLTWKTFSGKEKPRNDEAEDDVLEQDNTEVQNYPFCLSMDEIIAHVAKKDKYSLLFSEGDWEKAGYSSQSEADLALCLEIAFWCNRNENLTDSVYRESALYTLPGRAEKWDKIHFQNGDTYGIRTVKKACELQKDTYAEWKQRQDIESSFCSIETPVSLPAVIPFSLFRDEPLPELPEPIIDGVLRKGHKLIITGASKMGKSWLMINLAISIAEGLPWLGFSTKQGKVLYVNLEIDQISFMHRIADTYERMLIPKSERHYENLDLWCLRGQAKPMDKLVNELTREIESKGYELVIIDPIYKVLTGAENDASDMAYFCNQFDKICELGCSTAYVHHHSKGASNYIEAMNRGSGSGVFARDADALIDFSSLNLMKDGELITSEYDLYAKAYRAEFTLREFRTPEPINVWFENCMFRIDNETLSECALNGSSEANRNRSPNTQKHAERRGRLSSAYDSADKKNGLALVNQVAEIAKVDQKTIRAWVKEFSQEYFINNGLIGKNVNI